MREISGDGRIVNKVDVAHAAGWRVGERVQRKETAEQGTLLEVLDANSVVEMSGGEKFVVPTKDLIDGLWRRLPQPAPPEILPTEALAKSELFLMLAKKKAQIQLQVCQASATSTKLELHKPRGVRVLEDVASLTLCPSTDRVEIKEGAPTSNAVCIGDFTIKGQGRSYRFTV